MDTNGINKNVSDLMKKDTYNDMDTICETLFLYDGFVLATNLSSKAIVPIPMSTIHKKLNSLEAVGAILATLFQVKVDMFVGTNLQKLLKIHFKLLVLN